MKYVVYLIVIAIAVNTFSVYQVDGNSMMDTLHSGEIVITIGGPLMKYECISSILLKRNRIVTFHEPLANNMVIKRVAAVGKDKVYCSNTAALYINGRRQYEPYVTHAAVHPLLSENVTTITIPPGYFYALSDNRRNGMDSRTYGYISIHAITGVAIMVIR
jgi:signal peptidase I